MEVKSISTEEGEAMDELKEDGAKLVACKKRKLCSELEDECCGDVESSENGGALKNTSSRSLDLKKVDLKSEGLGTNVSTSINAIFSRETTPTRDTSEDSREVVMKLYLALSTPRKKTSPPAPANPRRKIPTEMSPSATEIEEFFAASEKLEQQRFAEKYNYDIVKDVPLMGKYEWVRLQR